MLADRMSKVVHELLSPYEAQGRYISDNIIMANEMVNEYGRIRTPKKCYLRIDLKKAFVSFRS